MSIFNLRLRYITLFLVFIFPTIFVGNTLDTNTTNRAGQTNTGSEFITTWRTTTANESISIPFVGSYTIDWGDGTVESATNTAIHTYTVAGDYQVKVSGGLEQIVINNAPDRHKLRSLDSWGSIAWTSMESAFRGTSNMVYNAVDTPDLSGVINMNSMFSGASSFDGDLSGWDVSNVTDMYSMFMDASSFNGDLSGWDVSNVTSMYSMFSGASSFDGDLSGWDVSNVTSMYSMFSGASSFDGDLSGWDVSNVTSMSGMFNGASSFDGDLSGWDVSNVTSMTSMFSGANSFTADLSPWYITLSRNILDPQNDSITISAQNGELTNQLNTPRYSLVSGEGDTDNSLFTIDSDGVTLRAKDLSALAIGAYSIRIGANSPDFGSGDARAFSIIAGETFSPPDNQTTKEMRFYPNPVSNDLHIENPQGGDVLYRVYNLLGKQLATHRQSGLHHQLDVGSLAEGVYLLEAQHGNQTSVFRFVKK
jgi:surface protein